MEQVFVFGKPVDNEMFTDRETESAMANPAKFFMVLYRSESHF